MEPAAPRRVPLASAASACARPRPYTPRHPEASTLHRVLADDFESLERVPFDMHPRPAARRGAAGGEAVPRLRAARSRVRRGCAARSAPPSSWWRSVATGGRWTVVGFHSCVGGPTARCATICAPPAARATPPRMPPTSLGTASSGLFHGTRLVSMSLSSELNRVIVAPLISADDSPRSTSPTHSRSRIRLVRRVYGNVYDSLGGGTHRFPEQRHIHTRVDTYQRRICS